MSIETFLRDIELQSREAMESLFGKGSCYLLRIRPVGGIELKD